jgi:hypothetical protein
MVMKPDGSWRPCSDYWWMNLVTIMDSYPLPKKADFANNGGVLHFLHGRPEKGVSPDLHASRHISTMVIITQFGLREFLRMMFGLRNVGNTF